jgi:proline iminopeptidase
MEGFVKDHVDDHPEVAGYVAAPTTRLDRLTDAGATAVLQPTVPAYLFNYWHERRSSRPLGSRFGCTRLPPEGICGPRWAALLHERVPAAELTILEDTGHLAHVERPAEFNTAVLTFLRAHGVLRGQQTP